MTGPAAIPTGVFASSDGTSLHYETFEPAAEPLARVVIVHGFDDHAGRYTDLARRLADEGFGVFTFDYRGHGRAEGKRGHCVRFEDYLGDLESALALARSAGDTTPIVVLAQSFGALIALRLLCDPTRGFGAIDAAVFCSPYLGPAFHLKWFEALGLGLCSRLLPALTVPNRLRPDDLTHDLQQVALRERDPLLHGVATARWCMEAARAQREVADHLRQLAVPSLWLIAGADRVADPEVSRLRYEAVLAEKDLRLYAGFFHELFNEIGRDRVVSGLLGWLHARYGAHAGDASGPGGTTG